MITWTAACARRPCWTWPARAVTRICAPATPPIWPGARVQTGAVASIAGHSLRLLRQLSFRVTVNTDNRLMSQVTLSSEFYLLAMDFGYGWADIEWLTVNAMKSAFAGFDERLHLINTVIKPGFAIARAKTDAVVRNNAQ